MLRLQGITKIYEMGDTKIHALKGVDLDFRKNEFVSILGPSGCGKTTMLNIIGGLDRYTEGDLLINNISTKKFMDNDWDAYRNDTIGFVFQSYNLISHQNVLTNVELALTLSGVSIEERKKRAIAALESVGLGDQLKKRPNQLSGGQMQRVAIARAIVNNPDILLADEPTGALDSATSEQIMDILQELAKDKLVIMVTHNQELAEQRSSRIIKLLDGNVIEDSNPLTEEEKVELGLLKKAENTNPKKSVFKKSTSMSYFTALALSLNNLLTKKARTFLTSFAGSIGIIGIALVLALSNGFNLYIKKLEGDTISAYPITIEETAINYELYMNMGGTPQNVTKYPTDNIINISKIIEQLDKISTTNNITDNYINNVIKKIDSKYINDVVYRRSVPLNIYMNDSIGTLASPKGIKTVETGNFWSEIVNSKDFILSQYDIIATADGSDGLPTKHDEVILIVDSYNQVSDLFLASLGLYDLAFKDNVTFKKIMESVNVRRLTNDVLYSKQINSATGKDFYTKNVDISEDTFNEGMQFKVVGILRLKPDTMSGCLSGNIGYSPLLTDYILEIEKDSEIVKAQNANTNIDILTGQTFEALSMASAGTSNSSTPDEIKIKTLKRIGAYATVSRIDIYAKDFDSKKEIKAFLDEYNNAQENEADKVVYTDIMELVMKVMTRMIDIISYVLIAFTSISLVVSSIMIGIITYISVIERTKEIGILRSIGARKKDISRVFNAETLIIGFVAGALGIFVTLILTIPINMILKHFVEGISNLAKLNWWHGIVLILVSMFLTYIAGLIPSRIAAKKDPVEALRTE